MGVTRFFGLIGTSRSLLPYESKWPDNAPLTERLTELAGLRLSPPARAAAARRLAAELQTDVPGLSRGGLDGPPSQTKTDCRDITATKTDGHRPESALVEGFRFGWPCGWKAAALPECRGRFYEGMFGD